MWNVKVIIGSTDIKNLLQDTDIVITVDTFRCNTTIITALMKGASAIYPTLTVKEALELSSELKNSILTGERNGKKIDVFDFGNSPTELRTEAIEGKPVVMTTTNGTRLIVEASKKVDSLLIGGILNATACCSYAHQLSNGHRDIRIIVPISCSDLYLEDVYTAGLLTNLLVSQGFKSSGDLTIISALIAGNPTSQIQSLLTSSYSAQKISKLGYADDINYCLQQDYTTIVPILDVTSGAIVASTLARQI